mgnify:FL=1
MAADARKKSESGYYHVSARGNGRQLIFEDDDDRRLLLQKLEEVFARKHIVVIAWCLMGNHFHLALLDQEQALSAAFQAVLSSYARIYNRKTGHSGHLFDARFWSEPIESEAQLLETVRYIHNNPQKAGIEFASRYRWSSYGQYARGGEGLADTSMVLELSGGPRGFVAFMNSILPVWDPMEEELERLRRDSRIVEVLAQHGIASPAKIKTLPKPVRDDLLVDLRARGFSIRELERLTGIGKGVIQRL